MINLVYAGMAVLGWLIGVWLPGGKKKQEDWCTVIKGGYQGRYGKLTCICVWMNTVSFIMNIVLAVMSYRGWR
jgi:hypothetical protein